MNLPFFDTFTLKNQPYNNLKQKFNFLSKSGLELMNKLFTYNPKKRITAENALECDYFKEKPYRNFKISTINFDHLIYFFKFIFSACEPQMMPSFPDNRSN